MGRVEYLRKGSGPVVYRNPVSLCDISISGMWLILRKHTESIFRVSGEREEEGCFIMQEGRDPLSLITWVIIIVTVSLTVFSTAGALVVRAV